MLKIEIKNLGKECIQKVAKYIHQLLTFGCFPLSGKWQEINVGEGVKKKEPLYTVGNVNWCRHYGKQYGVSSKN